MYCMALALRVATIHFSLDVHVGLYCSWTLESSCRILVQLLFVSAVAVWMPHMLSFPRDNSVSALKADTCFEGISLHHPCSKIHLMLAKYAKWDKLAPIKIGGWRYHNPWLSYWLLVCGRNVVVRLSSSSRRTEEACRSVSSLPRNGGIFDWTGHNSDGHSREGWIHVRR